VVVGSVESSVRPVDYGAVFLLTPVVLGAYVLLDWVIDDGQTAEETENAGTKSGQTGQGNREKEDGKAVHSTHVTDQCREYPDFGGRAAHGAIIPYVEADDRRWAA
jgi:hypothetical protein